MSPDKWKKTRDGYIQMLGTYMVEFIEAMNVGDEDRKKWCTDQVDRLTKAYCWQLQKQFNNNETRNKK